MTARKERHLDALISALGAARQNAQRWMEMSPEFSADSEQMEQWRSTARLRRSEVERIEKLVTQTIGNRGSGRPAGHEDAVAGSERDATS